MNTDYTEMALDLSSPASLKARGDSPLTNGMEPADLSTATGGSPRSSPHSAIKEVLHAARQLSGDAFQFPPNICINENGTVTHSNGTSELRSSPPMNGSSSSPELQSGSTDSMGSPSSGGGCDISSISSRSARQISKTPPSSLPSLDGGIYGGTSPAFAQHLDALAMYSAMAGAAGLSPAAMISSVGLDSPGLMPYGSLSSYIAQRKRRPERVDNNNTTTNGTSGDAMKAESPSLGEDDPSDSKKIKIVPEDRKDEAYWERRRKNNEAAKRSRDARRQKEEEIAMRAAFLEQENLKLRAQVALLKNETAKLHYMLYSRA